jgi:hypothetical protein
MPAIMKMRISYNSIFYLAYLESYVNESSCLYRHTLNAANIMAIERFCA